MQARWRAAAVIPMRLQEPEDLPCRHHIACPDRGLHRFIGRAQRPVTHRDDPTPGDGASERDRALTRRADAGSGLTGQVHPPMPR